MERQTRSLAEFEETAQEFASGLQPRTEGATLITLSGELGAGKTAFTKAVAKAFNVPEVVNSPTFVLEKVYQLPGRKSGSGFARLIHIDAYRLESGAELAPLDLEHLMHDSTSLIFLEWPEKVADALPRAQVAITIVGEGDTRTISYA